MNKIEYVTMMENIFSGMRDRERKVRGLKAVEALRADDKAPMREFLLNEQQQIQDLATQARTTRKPLKSEVEIYENEMQTIARYLHGLDMVYD